MNWQTASRLLKGSAMRDNCFRDDGTPRQITSARFSVIAPGRIRWELLADGDVLNHSEMVSPEELPVVFEITAALLHETVQANDVRT